MEDYTAEDLFKLLNQQDECDWIEAKGGFESSHSVMETVCAFSNEPSLGSGYILLGVSEDKTSLFPQYKTTDIRDPDKFQRDFVSRCSSMFNIPVRPKVLVEKVNGDTVIKVKVDELAPNQKPLYFKADGLPTGAYRRIGSTDQKCTEDDLRIFYTDAKSYDQTPMPGTGWNDIDENALRRYRILRGKVNAAAEELSYSDEELLEALGCLSKLNKKELNLAGLVLFGTSKSLRAHMPMLRVDYIRIPGNTWVENPDERFTTIDMRGPLLLLVYRLIEAICADLPQDFLLSEDEIQATAVGLPSKVLREAMVNAVMHRSYREHRPIQVIRYDNRIEIINPGYSLKSEDRLGEPGSETRNPFIAAVFHETNLAETKGSGIRAMRKLMVQAQLVPPTFESDRNGNQFVSRLLLHHFLDERDLLWLAKLEEFQLSDGQKLALIFVREVGAIDNQTYRQMTDCDSLKASNELRILKNLDLLANKGKGRATYYVQGNLLVVDRVMGTIIIQEKISTPPNEISTPPNEISTPPNEISTPPNEILNRIAVLKKREHDVDKIRDIIVDLCKIRAMKAIEIAGYFGKGEDYIKRKYLSAMIAEKQLQYTFPEMLNHPDQAYKCLDS